MYWTKLIMPVSFACFANSIPWNWQGVVGTKFSNDELAWSLRDICRSPCVWQTALVTEPHFIYLFYSLFQVVSSQASIFHLKKVEEKKGTGSLSLSPPGGFFITMILVWSIHWLCRSPSSVEEFGWPPLVSTRTQNLV